MDREYCYIVNYFCLTLHTYFTPFHTITPHTITPHTPPQEQRAATKENVERRMARTADELLEEEEGEEEVEEEESEDEETVPYNPKNLPLGWDGKVVGRNLRREGEKGKG